MSAEVIAEFTLNEKVNRSGEMAGMEIRIFSDGDSVRIVGTSNGEEYEGGLVLTKRVQAGGDECWVCPSEGGAMCYWEQPCRH